MNPRRQARVALSTHAAVSELNRVSYRLMSMTGSEASSSCSPAPANGSGGAPNVPNQSAYRVHHPVAVELVQCSDELPSRRSKTVRIGRLAGSVGASTRSAPACSKSQSVSRASASRPQCFLRASSRRPIPTSNTFGGSGRPEGRMSGSVRWTRHRGRSRGRASLDPTARIAASVT
jgi:hypothetical protein